MIHVIIPTFNRLRHTISCINSLKKQINFKELNIIIFDDASSDGTAKHIKTNFPEITVLNGDGFFFWGGAVKSGIEYAIKISKPNDWVLLVNNDIELSETAVSELILISERENRRAVVGSLSISAIDRKTIIKSGTIVKNWFLNKTFHVYANLTLDNRFNLEPVKVDFITGRCLLHPIEIFKNVGNYDSKNFRHYGADDEFSIRLKKFGYSVLLCPSSIIFLKPNEHKVYSRYNLVELYKTLFSIKSSSNIVNKFKLSLKVAPFYSKFSFFLIGVFKSIYLFFVKKV